MKSVPAFKADSPMLINGCMQNCCPWGSWRQTAVIPLTLKTCEPTERLQLHHSQLLHSCTNVADWLPPLSHQNMQTLFNRTYTFSVTFSFSVTGTISNVPTVRMCSFLSHDCFLTSKLICILCWHQPLSQPQNDCRNLCTLHLTFQSENCL